MGWIEELPKKLSNSLNSLLKDTEKHEETYMEAGNASVGQIWVAMAQMNQRLEKVEDLLQAHRKAMKEQGLEVDKHLDRNLEESLKRY
ncbi:MAG: hypothetical protein ABEJ87_03130 [Candidatus Nanohalobium sp.]